MIKRLVLLSILLIGTLLLSGCSTNKPPEAAKSLAENLGIPCVSMEDLKTNCAYYTDGCIAYGTVTRISFDDFSEDSVKYKEYMDRFHQTLVDHSMPMIDELMLSMELDIKNTYSYRLFMDGDAYDLYGSLQYETSSTHNILDIANGDKIYAKVKPKKNSVLSEDVYDLNVVSLTVYDKANRDESTKPVASEKVTKTNNGL